MDFSKFKIHDWLMIGGGAAMLILGFALDWTSIDTGFGSASGDGPFDYFLTGGIAWVLVVAVGVLALLRAAEMLPDNRPWAVIFVGATGLATILMVLRIVLGARDRSKTVWLEVGLPDRLADFLEKLIADSVDNRAGRE